MVSEAAYISTREAAQLLNISLRTAQLWVESGALLAWKTNGGHRRILLSSVNAVLEERKRLSIDPKSAQSTHLKIAIVEDDLDLIQLLQMAISSLPFPTKIEATTDGFKGLIMMSEFRPDVLILDLNMPHLDGFRMIGAIEGSEFAPATLIVSTALSEHDITDRGGLPKRALLLQKPFSIEALQALIEPKN